MLKNYLKIITSIVGLMILLFIFAKQITSKKYKIMNYDNWKQQTPPEEPQKKCAYCGEPSETRYCDKNCKKAYENDN